MATDAAAKMEEEFRRKQSRLSARLTSTAFSRTTWILAFVGALLLCFTLFKTPNVQGGLPLPLNHEYLISFAVASGVGIFLNLLSFFIHLLAWINVKNLNKTQAPSLEVIVKCFRKQNKLITAINLTELLILYLGSLFQIYVFLVGLPLFLIPNVDPNSYKGRCFRQIEYSSHLLFILTKGVFDGFPRHWIL